MKTVMRGAYARRGEDVFAHAKTSSRPPRYARCVKFAIADTAALLGDASRAAMLLALMDGRALPSGELADAAGISAPAASIHLAKLERGGLVAVQQQGRHRYYRLGSPEVAQALEALGNIASTPPPRRAPSPERDALRAA